MFRSARQRSWLTALVLAGAVAVSPAARADERDDYAPGPRTVIVGDQQFKNSTTRVLVNENVTFVLKDEARMKHSVTFGNPPNPTAPKHYEFDPADPNPPTVTVTFDRPGYHTYRCTFHGFDGVIKVRNPVTATTTTTAPAPTTTTTGPAALTAAGSKSKPGALVSASTATSTTTAAPATPSSAAPPPGAGATPPVTTTAAEDLQLELAGADGGEQAYDAATQEDGAAAGESIVLLILAIGLAAALLGGGGWAWYHRPSRYQPA